MNEIKFIERVMELFGDNIGEKINAQPSKGFPEGRKLTKAEVLSILDACLRRVFEEVQIKE